MQNTNGNTNSNYLVHVHDVVKNFQGPAGVIHVLRKVNLTVNPGEFVGVRGPSGSGKSTLINMITGIDRPTDGAVRVRLHRVRQYLAAGLQLRFGREGSKT